MDEQTDTSLMAKMREALHTVVRKNSLYIPSNRNMFYLHCYQDWIPSIIHHHMYCMHAAMTATTMFMVLSVSSRKNHCKDLLGSRTN